MSLVKNPEDIKVAMLGMVDANGHPYSWTTIINGAYDSELLYQSEYPMIGDYLAKEPAENLGIDGVKVTHIWCDNPKEAEHVAKTTYIDNIVSKPEDVIGYVDAVIIPTDKGHEHVDRARPFIEAEIPVFIDKPMTDNIEGLRQFIKWHEQGKPFMSTSCMRYAREFSKIREDMQAIGDLRLLTITTPKSWERYGIHALEVAYQFLKPGGWLSVTNTGTKEANIIHAHHDSDAEVILSAISDMYGAFGCLGLYGTKGNLNVNFKDTYYAFKTQMEGFVGYLRTGKMPFEFSETIELMKIIIAGIESRQQDGKKILLKGMNV